MEVSSQEMMAALGILFQMNPLANEQFQGIILKSRLAAAEAKLAQAEALLASKNGAHEAAVAQPG